jgi:hypothetical protein
VHQHPFGLRYRSPALAFGTSGRTASLPTVFHRDRGRGCGPLDHAAFTRNL